MKIINEEKDFTPANTKKDTCVAVAYSMLTGTPYEDALQLFPNGKQDTLKQSMDLTIPSPEENTLGKFISKHHSGKFMVGISDNIHKDGHAIPVINGIAYNTQNYNRNSSVTFYVDFSSSRSVTNDTSYLDEFEKHQGIDDNKYINYAYQKILSTHGAALANKGNLRTKAFTNGTSQFGLDVNGKEFTFDIPFNCSDRDVTKIIDDTIEKTRI